MAGFDKQFMQIQHGTFEEFCAPVGTELWMKLPPDRLARRCTKFVYDDGTRQYPFGDIILHGEGEFFKTDDEYEKMATDCVTALLKGQQWKPGSRQP